MPVAAAAAAVAAAVGAASVDDGRRRHPVPPPQALGRALGSRRDLGGAVGGFHGGRPRRAGGGVGLAANGSSSAGSGVVILLDDDRMMEGLLLDEVPVCGAPPEELVVRPDVGQGGAVIVVVVLLTPSQDRDLIGLLDGGETVGHHHDRPSLRGGVHGLLHEELRFGVQRRGGLVEKQDGGLPQYGPRDRQALLLAPAEGDTPLPDQLVEPARKPHDEVVGVGGLAGLQQLVVGDRGGILQAVAEVVADGHPEQGRFLLDVPETLSQHAQRDPTDVRAVEPDRSLVRVVKALQKRDDGALSGPAGTHNRGRLVPGNRQAEVPKNRSVGSSGIGKGDP
mmetsp:Transcript_7434/g.18225  ORF Transcript_7434/g.18225 Transcript_7434/m.18225 type:complete len:337 (+) Transcript_7434:1877-2887(+)